MKATSEPTGTAKRSPSSLGAVLASGREQPTPIPSAAPLIVVTGEG